MLLTMLIVEDQDPMRAALRDFLQRAYPQIMVVEAADGASAIAQCRRHTPRLVFMDVGLPDGNGIELTRRVRSLLPESAVIIVSQHAGPVYVERARAAGAAGYVTKDRIYSELLPLTARSLGSAAESGRE